MSRLSKKGLSRRSFATALGAGAGLLPFIPMLNSRAENGSGFPQRLVLFYIGSGIPHHLWRPPSVRDAEGSEFFDAPLAADFELSPILAPFSDFRDQTLILDGIDNEAAIANWGTRGYSHSAILGLLTGRRIPDGPFTENFNVNGSYGWPQGPSVDQVIAEATQGTAPLRSLNLGIRTTYPVGAYPELCRWIHRGPDQPDALHDDPYALFNTIFAGADLNTAERARLAQRREQVLSVVGRDLHRARGKLPQDDREKIDRHVAHLEEVTGLLTTYVGEGCDPSEPMPGLDPASAAHDQQNGLALRGIIAGAFACDVTRVASLSIMGESNSFDLPELNLPGAADSELHNHHDRAHDGNATYGAMWTWHMQQLADFLRLLDSYPEGDGTLLDNTLVMVTSGIGQSTAHAHRSIPIALFGGGGGFEMGRYVRWGAHPTGPTGNEYSGGRSLNDLYVSMCQSFGVDIDTFGDPDLCNGPLPSLT